MRVGARPPALTVSYASDSGPSKPGGYRVVPTEGGHIDFAPLDSLEDNILQQLRTRFRRVSVERIVSGSGFANIHGAMAAIEGRASVAPRAEIVPE